MHQSQTPTAMIVLGMVWYVEAFDMEMFITTTETMKTKQ